MSTLDNKLKIWRKDVGINQGMWLGPCIGYCCSRDHVLHRIWMERFTVARDIASAMQYLHCQDIVYRDLKPDNIGFDSEGVLKMFDFGLAKRVTSADKTDGDLYNLTGNTGTYHLCVCCMRALFRSPTSSWPRFAKVYGTRSSLEQTVFSLRGCIFIWRPLLATVRTFCSVQWLLMQNARRLRGWERAQTQTGGLVA